MASGIRIDMSYNNLAKLAKALPDETDKIVQETADALRTEMIESMQEPKSGRSYGAHVASAPGEAPAVDSGNLSGNTNKSSSNKAISVEKIKIAHAKLTVNTDYGAALEYGSRRKRGGVLRSRPFVRPAVKKIFPEFINQLKNLEGRIRWVR